MRRNNLVLLLIATDDSEDEARGDRCRKRGADPPKNDRRVGLKKLRIETTRDAGGVSNASTRLRRCAGATSFSAAPLMASRMARNEMSFSAQAEQVAACLYLAGVSGVELTVDQRMQQNLGFIAFHSAVPEAVAGPDWTVMFSLAFHADRSMARARANRDMTVPTGTPATSAISL